MMGYMLEGMVHGVIVMKGLKKMGQGITTKNKFQGWVYGEQGCISFILHNGCFLTGTKEDHLGCRAFHTSHQLG